VPLLVTERIVKADVPVSAMETRTLGPPACGTGGRNSDDGKVALADLEHVALEDRVVVIAFDSD
jgi:hypothetical protein